MRTNNPLERLNREIRRRTRMVGSFPHGPAALMLLAARLRYMAGQKWEMQRCMNMGQLEKPITQDCGHFHSRRKDYICFCYRAS